MEGRKLFSTRDLLVFGAIVLLAALALTLMRQAPQGVRAVVEVDGETAAVRDLSALSAPEELVIEGYGGIELRISFTPEGAQVLSSTCPDNTCVRTGVLTYAGESAICLPARVVLRLDGASSQGAPDAETY